MLHFQAPWDLPSPKTAVALHVPQVWYHQSQALKYHVPAQDLSVSFLHIIPMLYHHSHREWHPDPDCHQGAALPPDSTRAHNFRPHTAFFQREVHILPGPVRKPLSSLWHLNCIAVLPAFRFFYNLPVRSGNAYLHGFRSGYQNSRSCSLPGGKQ